MGKVKNKAAWDKLKQFPIGTKVLVSTEMRRARDAHERRWVTCSCDKPYAAWVVGARWVCDGKIVDAEKYSAFMDEPPEYVGAYMLVSKKTPVLLVRRAMFGKEIAVPIDGVEVGAFPFCSKSCVPGRAPLVLGTPQNLNKADRELLRSYAAEMERDKKGRWVKS